MEILFRLALIDWMAFLCLVALGALAWAAESGVLGDHKRTAGFSMLGLAAVFIIVLATSKVEDSLLFGEWEKSEKGDGKGKKSGGGKVETGGKGSMPVGQGGGKGPAQGGDDGGADGDGGADANAAGKTDDADVITGVVCADEDGGRKKASEDKKNPGALARPGLRPGAGLHDCPFCPRVALVPPGCTEVGAPTKQSGFRPEEAPVTRIKITAPYYIGRYEVTRGEFRAFVEATGYAPSQGCNGGEGWVAERNWLNPGFLQDNNHPVVCVNWADARAYVEWLSTTTGQRYRLPSEGEWEHAVRAGGKSTFPYGEKLEPADANFGKRVTGTVAVGQFAANAFGILDTVGNVWEMVQDCWEAGHHGLPLDGSARGQPNCEERIMRGGAWYDSARNLRSAARMPRKEGAAGWGLGFRVAREYSPPGQSSGKPSGRVQAPASPTAATIGNMQPIDASAVQGARGAVVESAGRAAPAATRAATAGVAAEAGAPPTVPVVAAGGRVGQQAAPKSGEAAAAKAQRKDGQAARRRERDQ